MNKNVFIILVLIPFFFTCKNSIDTQIEEDKCEVFISNLRYDISRMNDKLYLINGDSVYNRQMFDFYFDYVGDCLDSNAQLVVNYAGFYVPEYDYLGDMNSYTSLGEGQLLYDFKPNSIVDLENKIMYRIAFIFNNSQTIKVSVKIKYNAYDPLSGYVQKETNTLSVSFEKYDEML